MSTNVDLGQGAELRVAGSTVGVFLPEAQFRELNAERDSLRRDLEDARRRADELQRQVRALEAERDNYEKALTAAVRNQFDTMDEEKALALIAETERSGVDFADVVREVEAILYKKGKEGRYAG
jgi:chromosome segregation ATPase